MLYTTDRATGFEHQPEVERLLDRICVRPPYFALQNLKLGSGVFEAQASAELPAGREVGPMGGAELSRHAAIAGLCAAALAQGDDARRYYLARQATYQGFENLSAHGTPVELRAELVSLDKREALAHVAATANGSRVARLEVRYTVLTEAAFERLFRSRRQPTPPQRVMGHVPPGEVFRDGSAFVRVVDRVPVEACAGHFNEHPAMPVAVIMGQLTLVAAEALGDGVAYRGVSATVQAQDFCWAGESARFSATPEPASASRGRLSFDCAASAGGRAIATMRMTLEPVATAAG